ncbi:MAG: PAS domain-containing protein [Hydrogenophilales bacterium]|nr:PAS domain-containing protein [Hydrogenophilales bacterium]
MDASGSVGVRDADLGLIARHPSASSIHLPLGDKRLSAPFVAALKANPREGTYVSGATSLDGISRTHSYRRSARYGYTVNVGIADETVLAEWRKQAWIVVGLTALLIVAMLALAWSISRNWWRQERQIDEMQASRRILNEVQSMARLGYFDYDLRRDRITTSAILDEIFGIDDHFPHDAAHWLALVAPESRTEMRSYLDGVIEQGHAFDREYRIVRHSDGQERWVHGKGELRFDAAGKPLALIGTVQDITRQKNAESALADAKDYAENLIETANVMIVELDPSGRLKRFNRAATGITGYTKEDIQGKNWFEIIVPRDRYPDVWSEFERIISGNNRAEEFENPILTKSGEERYIVWRNSEIKAGGQVIGTLSFGIDVTETKKVQARLANSEAALVEAQSIAHIGNWAYDLTSRELTWSGEVFRILGLDPEQSQPSSQVYLQAVHPDDRVRVKAAYKQFLKSHRPYELKYQLLLQDGSTQYVSQQSRAIFDNAGNPLRFVGTLQDVTLQTIQEIGMQESEERFRTIANYTYGWEYWEGTQQEILYINPACERVSGYSSLQFITNPGLLAEIVHPDDRVLWAAHRHDIIGKSDGEVVFRIITKDGQVRGSRMAARRSTRVTESHAAGVPAIVTLPN